jgi:hypothetical protein
MFFIYLVKFKNIWLIENWDMQLFLDEGSIIYGMFSRAHLALDFLRGSRFSKRSDSLTENISL